jgi:hypothetical protein
MIQPTQPIIIPPISGQIADGLWISNLVISAPTTSGKIRAQATVVPFVSSDGSLIRSQSRQLMLNDVMALAVVDPSVAYAMGALFNALQVQITGQGLF